MFFFGKMNDFINVSYIIIILNTKVESNKVKKKCAQIIKKVYDTDAKNNYL